MFLEFVAHQVERRPRVPISVMFAASTRVERSPEAILSAAVESLSSGDASQRAAIIPISNAKNAKARLMAHVCQRISLTDARALRSSCIVMTPKLVAGPNLTVE